MNCFPYLTADQLQVIEQQAYRNLTDVLIETIKMASMRQSDFNSRFVIKPNADLQSCIMKRQSIVIASAHFGNWEWGALAIPATLAPMKSFGFYKPMSNRFIDRFEKKTRERFGLEAVSMFQTTKTFNKNRRNPSVFFLIADQSPSDKKTAIWIDFLCRPTAWLHGLEKHSRRHNYPVFLFIPIRTQRGHYEIEPILLTNEPGLLQPNELMERYVNFLEDTVKQWPEQWLWTHRRWKLKA